MSAIAAAAASIPVSTEPQVKHAVANSTPKSSSFEDLQLITLFKRLSLTDGQLEEAVKAGKANELFQTTQQQAEKEFQEAIKKNKSSELVEGALTLFATPESIKLYSGSEKTKWLEERRSILSQYAKIFQKYTISPTGGLSRKETIADSIGRKDTTIDSTSLSRKEIPVPMMIQTLFKVTKIIAEHHLKGSEEIFDTGIQCSVDDQTFLAKVQNNKIHIILWPGTQIGSGNFSTVYKVLSISQATLKALKLAKNNGTTKLENEITLLQQMKEMNGGKTPSGIQQAPSATFHIVNASGRLVGYVGKFYDGDLLNCLKKGGLSIEQGITCIKELTKSYKFFADRFFLNMDIKPENMLKLPGKKEFCFADWGSGTRVTKKKEENYEFPQTHAYANSKDLEEMREASVSENSRRFQTAARSHGIYSLGTTFFYALAKDFPYMPEEATTKPRFANEEPMTYVCSANLAFPFRKELLSQVPEALVKVIEGMVKHNPVERLTPEEVYKQMDAITIPAPAPQTN